MDYSGIPNLKIEHIAGRPVVTTSQGGKIVLDKILLALLQAAAQKSQAEITAAFQASNATTLTVAAGLACLAEAGLLHRENSGCEEPGELNKRLAVSETVRVSAVIVAYNGRNWLPECLRSLKEQALAPAEIIVVDNASGDGTAEWLGSNHPDVKVMRLVVAVPFAAALNQGIAAATGNYFLALNQDVSLEPEALIQMVKTVTAPGLAAAAPCLRLMWAPGFLNGLGNRVRVSGWGSDNFIGWLDLGQTESQTRVPSACFAAALIRREAWEKIGPLDEGFPMYYEDTEWCYRARLMGFEIGAAPEAVVYHAFGGGTSAGMAEMSATKLENVVYGRLRFHSKLYAGWSWGIRILACLVQDLGGVAGAALRGRIDLVKARWLGWRRWLKQLPGTVKDKPKYSNTGKVIWSANPRPRMWHGLPELTWEGVCCDYLPLMVAGKTRRLPEMEELGETEKKKAKCSWGVRMVLLWEGEGLRAVLRNWRRKMR
jgi:GT2 family glycosyltransferase